MDQPTAEDLLYLAELMKDIQRPKDGLDLMGQLAKIKPNFNSEERSLFNIIFKAAVDTLRKTLRTLYNNYLDEEDNGKKDYAEKIKPIIDETFSDLQNVCNKTLKVIDDYLLPNSESVQSKVFFLKFKGDIHRYISEFADGDEKEKALSQADESYLAAIPLAEKELIKSDPIQLGLILNYAVFKYEHKLAHEEAKKLLNDAINLLNDDFSELTEDSQKESKSIVEVMYNNLKNWEETSGEDEEEEENS